MTRRNATGMIPIRDPLPVALELMRALAISVLNEHSGKARLRDAGTPTPITDFALHSLRSVGIRRQR